MEDLILEYLKRKSFYEGKVNDIYDIESDLLFSLLENQTEYEKERDEKYLTINSEMLDYEAKKVFGNDKGSINQDALTSFLTKGNNSFIKKQFNYMFLAYKRMGIMAKIGELLGGDIDSYTFVELDILNYDEMYKLIIDIEGDSYIIDELRGDTYFAKGVGYLTDMAMELGERYDYETKEIAKSKKHILKKH